MAIFNLDDPAGDMVVVGRTIHICNGDGWSYEAGPIENESDITDWLLQLSEKSWMNQSSLDSFVRTARGLMSGKVIDMADYLTEKTIAKSEMPEVEAFILSRGHEPYVSLRSGCGRKRLSDSPHAYRIMKILNAAESHFGMPALMSHWVDYDDKFCGSATLLLDQDAVPEFEGFDRPTEVDLIDEVIIVTFERDAYPDSAA